MPTYKVLIIQTATVTIEAEDPKANVARLALDDYNMGFDNVVYREPTIEDIEELPCQPTT